jgi:hypothetical protein
MLALTHVEMARNEFLEVFILSGVGFLASTVCLFFQLFRRKAFLHFINWDANFDRWLGFPQWWTTGFKKFARSRAHMVFWSILVGVMFALMCFGLCGYLIARHHLSQNSPPNKSQPTPVGRLSFAFTVDIAGPAWLTDIRTFGVYSTPIK